MGSLRFVDFLPQPAARGSARRASRKSQSFEKQCKSSFGIRRDSPLKALGVVLLALGGPTRLFSNSYVQNRQWLSAKRSNSVRAPHAVTASIDEGDSETFASLYGDRLPSWLLERAASLGYVEPTRVQAEALDLVLDGSDCIVQATTGSGKTLVYLLPLLANLSTQQSLQAMVVLPSRELAKQVTLVARGLASGLRPERLTVMALLDGSGAKRQKLWFKARPPQVIVGNVEQINSFLQNGVMALNNLKMLVVDEVDACLMKDETCLMLKSILSGSLSMRSLERSQSRQTLFVSATVPQRSYFIKQCVQQRWCLNEPIVVHTDPTQKLPAQIRHTWAPCKRIKRIAGLKLLLRQHEPTLTGGIIFFEPDFYDVQEIAEALTGIVDEKPPAVLSEEQPLRDREDALRNLRDKSARLILSTTLGARGLDIPHCSHVYMLDVPANAEKYVHAAG
eukprot:CAMPEP_0169247586 /NCGR_PEP_ID=MMETSP1016-20121227/35366_1 /TAXON_ID=342587 /ORGANISM="Karlodinium micrum, Strain CCMP2283" /LENGTH=449 /DNA_ID=CAMNT_0009328281 /DNA_START=25 /DNA_END=1371 /DNA_ORIENTATION=-